MNGYVNGRGTQNSFYIGIHRKEGGYFGENIGKIKIMFGWVRIALIPHYVHVHADLLQSYIILLYIYLYIHVPAVQSVRRTSTYMLDWCICTLYVRTCMYV